MLITQLKICESQELGRSGESHDLSWSPGQTGFTLPEGHQVYA